MNLMRWRPQSWWDPWEEMRQEMDRLLQPFGGNREGEGHGLRGWTPQIDVSERNNELVVRADLPGVDPKDVDITVRDDTLILSGEKREEKEDNERNVHRVERFVGRFYRAIPLPRGTDLDKIRAHSDRGVLTVTVPTKQEAQPRRIQVHAGQEGQASASGRSSTQSANQGATPHAAPQGAKGNGARKAETAKA